MHRKAFLLRALRGLAATALLLVGPAGTVGAAQLLVTANTDAVAQGDGCSLREALINANTNSKAGSMECVRGSASEDDVIILPPATIYIEAPLAVTENLVVLGGSGTWSVLDGRLTTRLLDVSPGVSLDIRGVRLLRGGASGNGGAIRVQQGGSLRAEYLVVTSSRVTGTGSSGGGVYLDQDVTATISRSEFSYNEALDAGGVGAGIRCAVGCTLSIDNSTVTGNRAAAAGGGLYVEGNANLLFTTLADNAAPTAAGIWLSGTADLFASIAADNKGTDLECDVAATVTGTTSYVATPGLDCPLPAVGVMNPAAPPAVIFTRAWLPALLGADALSDTSGSGYVNAPGRAHRIMRAYAPYLAGLIPASELHCSSLLDQFGRKRRPGTNCDLGAMQAPTLSVWQMGVSMKSTDPGMQLLVYLHDVSAQDTLVSVKAVQGVGENCSDSFNYLVTVPAFNSTGQVFVSPDSVFALPGLNRPVRVCEYSAEVVSPAFTLGGSGPTAGNLRVRIEGTPLSSIGFSSPEPGYYLNFDSVPVGSGGLRSLVLTPLTGGFAVTQVEFTGNDANRFEVASGAAETAPGSGIFVMNPPLVVADKASGGTALPIRCRAGALGDFDAEMLVRTDGSYGDVLYGVRCSSRHLLSVSSLTPRVEEQGDIRGRFALTLDSPCLLDEDGLGGDDGDGTCFVATLADAGSTATAGVDFEALPATVAFDAGEQQKIVEVRVIDDGDVEADEVVSYKVSVPASPQLQISGPSTLLAQIDDDDTLSRQIGAFLRGLPQVATPGQNIPFSVQVHNRGNALLRGARLEVAVEKPMVLRSFAMIGATCTMAVTKRRATCILTSDLLPNQKALLDASGNPLSIETDEADVTRRDDGDWVTVYGRLVTAEMNSVPVFDVSGDVSVSARAGEPAVEFVTSQSVAIDAQVAQSIGGGGSLAPGIGWLLVLLLLPWRQRLRVAVGRRTGGRSGRRYDE